MVHHTDTAAGGSHRSCASTPADPWKVKIKGIVEGKGWGQARGRGGVGKVREGERKGKAGEVKG